MIVVKVSRARFYSIELTVRVLSSVTHTWYKRPKP
jgi:hypothetical protein